ncbi:MAG: tetratricopeptide repeat protein [Armatimonadota bacterium]
MKQRKKSALVVGALLLVTLLVVWASRGAWEPAVARSLPDGALHRLVQAWPGSGAVQLEVGRRAWDAGRLGEAEWAMAAAVELLPADPAARAEYTLVLADRQDMRNAEAAYRELGARFPGSPHERIVEARYRLASEGPGSAAPLLRELTERAPELAEAWYLLGYCAAERGATEEALSAFRRAVRLRPRSGRYHRELGQVLHRVGQLDAAEASIRRALELAPSDDATALALAELLLDRDLSEQKLTEAESLLQSARTSETLRLAACKALGRVALARNDWDAAERAYAEAAQSNGQDPDALYGLAQALRAKRDPRYSGVLQRFRVAETTQREERYLRGALKERPNDPETRARLARFYHRLGRVAEARAVLTGSSSETPREALSDAFNPQEARR